MISQQFIQHRKSTITSSMDAGHVRDDSMAIRCGEENSQHSLFRASNDRESRAIKCAVMKPRKKDCLCLQGTPRPPAGRVTKHNSVTLRRSNNHECPWTNMDDKNVQSSPSPVLPRGPFIQHQNDQDRGYQAHKLLHLRAGQQEDHAEGFTERLPDLPVAGCLGRGNVEVHMGAHVCAHIGHGMPRWLPGCL